MSQPERSAMTGKLAGKVAVVTGGSAGIGLGIAEHFAKEGARVFITGRHQSELDKAAAAIGGNAAAIRGDTTNLADLDRIYATVKTQAGHIDVLAANAGVYEFAKLGEITEEHFDRTFNTNVRGLLFAVQKALPLLGKGSSVILDRLDGVDQGLCRRLGVRRDKGRDTLVCPRLDRRPQGARHSGQRVEPRLHGDPRPCPFSDG